MFLEKRLFSFLIFFPCFAEHPSDSLVNEIMFIMKKKICYLK